VYLTHSHLEDVRVKYLFIFSLIVVFLLFVDFFFTRLMEVKALETLIRLLQGDEDGASDGLPERVSVERTSGCGMQFPPIILDSFVLTKTFKQ